MALIPWKSKQRDRDGGRELSPVSALRHEMDRLFDSFLREPLAAMDWPFKERAWAPSVDVAETDREVIVRAEVPGIDPKDLDVTISGNQLILSGEKKEAVERSGKDFHVSESRYGSFRRSIPLPSTVDAENVEADCVHGVITIHLKKTQAAAAKRIEVKTKA
ncbi:MAG: Hsp20/alpha crystallin family protein [Thermoguttaceae bacterium]|jgi:HSP20 family protein